jgi:uncharacterized membrane protein YphA (DoxX/SURF4 family)
MALAHEASIVLSAALFLLYGFLCLFSNGMQEEFERYGLSRFRRLTGGLEVLGGAGLLVGLLLPPVLVVASGGLALLMLLGVIARVRVRDPLLQTMPAAFLLVVNLSILVVAWRALTPG